MVRASEFKVVPEKLAQKNDRTSFPSFVVGFHLLYSDLVFLSLFFFEAILPKVSKSSGQVAQSASSPFLFGLEKTLVLPNCRDTNGAWFRS